MHFGFHQSVSHLEVRLCVYQGMGWTISENGGIITKVEISSVTASNQSKSLPRPWPEYETHYTIGTCQWVTPTDHPKYSRSHWISNSGFSASNETDTIIRTGEFSCTTNTEKNYLDLRWFLCHADNFLLTQITGTPSSSFGKRNIIRVPYLGVKNSKLKDTSKFLSLCPCLHLKSSKEL